MENFLTQLIQLALLALAVSVIAITITKSALFREMRAAIAQRNQKLGELISCPYCFSHWLSIGAVLLFQVRPVQVPVASLWFLDYVVSIFAIVGFATFFTAAIYRAAKSVH